jgi:predicted nucleotidyltransferase
VEARIRAELERIEVEERVRIVYACESGSRAWGFPSADSDYDVRFIYVRPPADYLRVSPLRDVIERPPDAVLDVTGWDIRKALGLLGKSNPPLLEWLSSPVVYREDPGATARLRALVPVCASPAASHFHYLHMAEGNDREYLHGDEVWLKKYLYVLRPVLACRWIERGLGAVPMAFAELVERVVEDPDVRAGIDDLMRRKRAGEELDRGPRIPVVSDFLDSELCRLRAVTAPPAGRVPPETLDEVFRSILAEVHGARF